MDTDKIIMLANKLKKKLGVAINEEQTKNSFVLPFFMALGYDVFDLDEFIPEYAADFGVKQGEKVDYAICINGQPIILIECKRLNTPLSSNHISQLYRYYSVTDARIGILTNGDDFWFFADSLKRNQMDQEPYLKIKLSNFDEKVKSAIEYYCRENIENIDIIEDVQVQRFRVTILEFLDKIQSGNPPSDFIDYLADKAEVKGLEKSRLAALFNSEYNKQLDINAPKVVETVTRVKDDISVLTSSTSNQNQREKYQRDKSKAVDLPLGVPLKYNAYNWAFHKPCSLVIDNDDITIGSFADAMVEYLSWIFKNYSDHSDKLIADLAARPNSFVLTTENDGTAKAIKRIPNTQYFINTKLASKDIIKCMEKASNSLGINHSRIKIVLSE